VVDSQFIVSVDDIQSHQIIVSPVDLPITPLLWSLLSDESFTRPQPSMLGKTVSISCMLMEESNRNFHISH